MVTIVTNSSGSSRVVEDLERELQILTREFGCQFTSVVRFGEHVSVVCRTCFYGEDNVDGT